MSTKLVLVHGRAQEGKDAARLKASWVEALQKGFAAEGLTLPVSDDEIRFPYYGDTLAQLTEDPQATDVAKVIVRGDGSDEAEANLIRAILTELLVAAGVTEDVIRAEAPPEVIARGPSSWEWVHKGLSIIDSYVPGASGSLIALVTKDVSKYMSVAGVRRRIDRGVTKAFAGCGADDELVVVAHSLGTLVTYNVLREQGRQNGWNVALFITLGSPLGVQAIRDSLTPITHPKVVGRWFNAFDQRDVVALYALDKNRFGIDPSITNHDAVRNDSSNHHGIEGYLSDSRVVREIHEAVS